MRSMDLIHFIRIPFIFWTFSTALYADTPSDPCGGPSGLLNLVDRPTAADSACAVPYKHVLLELGAQYVQYIDPSAHGQNIPEAEFRIGLPGNNELAMVLPNFIHQSIAPTSGFTATTIGIKHEIGYSQNWLAALEGLITPQGGSTAFGNQGMGAAFNGIIDYSFNSQLMLSLMLGVTTATQSNLGGGERYNSFNPDLVLSYALTQKLNLYGEVYGQSTTGPGEGSGFNFDGGLLYLIRPNVTVDLEVGQQISGNLGGFSHYVGLGIAVLG